ncbi:MAG: TIGR03862 family flavoprotein, partial [Verrucomicrobiota bacterium]
SFATRYSGGPDNFWQRLLEIFDAPALCKWASDLGCETFETKSGRVYLKDLKAASLLRRWVARLRESGVIFHMNHRLLEIHPGPPIELVFENKTRATFEAAILAFGGASWPETGSDGRWMPMLESLGLATTPLAPANCGWENDWSPEILAAAEGQPLKNIRVTAEKKSVSGELILTRYGLEGGPLYALGPILRAMPSPEIHLDLKPAHTVEQLVAKMESVRRNFASEARQRWKLGPAAHALLARREWTDPLSLAREAKHCLIPLKGPRPIAEAISSAGGLRWDELDENLMVKKIPGLFVCGEMIDWEAPTGGYLLQGCFATATLAAQSACTRLAR